jgi:hypothetical protein
MPQDVRESLRARGKALEEAFFRKEQERLREIQSMLHSEQSATQALREASGIDDEAVLQQLASLGVRAETLAALTLIPLVEVAWADDRMEEREREAVLAGAESSGIAVDSPSHGLLERLRLRENLVGRARRVAEAAGGFLGLRDPVSKVENAVLEDLATLF